MLAKHKIHLNINVHCSIRVFL